MVFGHNPTMEQLVNYLTGEIKRMPTAALAHIELPIQHWNALNLHTKGTLVNLWTPKTLFFRLNSLPILFLGLLLGACVLLRTASAEIPVSTAIDWTISSVGCGRWCGRCPSLCGRITEPVRIGMSMHNAFDNTGTSALGRKWCGDMHGR